MVADHLRSGSRRFGTEFVRKTENKYSGNPLVSNRNAESELGIPRFTICRVLRTKPKMFPYKISFLQKLVPKDIVESESVTGQFCREKRAIGNAIQEFLDLNVSIIAYTSLFVFDDPCNVNANFFPQIWCIYEICSKEKRFLVSA